MYCIKCGKPTDDPDRLCPDCRTADAELSSDVPGTDVPGTDVPGTDVPGTDVSDTDVSGTDAADVNVSGADGVPGESAGGAAAASASPKVRRVFRNVIIGAVLATAVRFAEKWLQAYIGEVRTMRQLSRFYTVERYPGNTLPGTVILLICAVMAAASAFAVCRGISAIKLFRDDEERGGRVIACLPLGIHSAGLGIVLLLNAILLAVLIFQTNLL